MLSTAGVRFCTRFLASDHALITDFFFNETATTEIYTLSLHDALPIWRRTARRLQRRAHDHLPALGSRNHRSEEHTSELQSQFHLVCRLLLEKKKRIVHPAHSLMAAVSNAGAVGSLGAALRSPSELRDP